MAEKKTPLNRRSLNTHSIDWRWHRVPRKRILLMKNFHQIFPWLSQNNNRTTGFYWIPLLFKPHLYCSCCNNFFTIFLLTFKMNIFIKKKYFHLALFRHCACMMVLSFVRFKQCFSITKQTDRLTSRVGKKVKFLFSLFL